MQDDFLISDDPGTILDSFNSSPQALAAGLANASPAVRTPRAAVEEVLYKSPYRWQAARVVICDDGSLDEGETVYLRSDKIVIGRSQGDIVIGHDTAMSGSHAEIVRRDVGGKYVWVLRDLGSSNGTLARIRTLTLKPGVTILLGSKRYRFELPVRASSESAETEDPGTALITDLKSLSNDTLPAFVECQTPGLTALARYPLRATRMTIGRPSCGNDIEIDDPCLAQTHAVVTRDPRGAWQLEARPTLNGVWGKVDLIRLTDNCYFQCGEQRFRFRL